MQPRTKLPPVSLVSTRYRWASTVATILVVVVLPLVPLTTTTPCGSRASRRVRKPREDLLHHQAGQRGAAPAGGPQRQQGQLAEPDREKFHGAARLPSSLSAGRRRFGTHQQRHGAVGCIPTREWRRGESNP